MDAEECVARMSTHESPTNDKDNTDEQSSKTADRDVWAEDPAAAGGATAERLDAFDASQACREVTCLYHDANWWLERAIEDPDVLEDPGVEPDEDFFL